MEFMAVNGSPRGNGGATGGLLQVFIGGMIEGGAAPVGRGPTVHLLKDLDIRPCRGDWACWSISPGRCVQEDDMNRLYPLVRQADILVLGTPVYVDGMTGLLKNFVDRLVATLDPMIELRDGHSRHPLQGGGEVDGGLIVLVSPCGFHETDNFEPLTAHVRAMCRNLGRRYGGALLRPHAPVLGDLLAGRPSSGKGGGRPTPPEDAYTALAEVANAVREAGRALAVSGTMPEEVLARAARPLVSREFYNEWVNAGWEAARRRLDRGGRAGE